MHPLRRSLLLKLPRNLRLRNLRLIRILRLKDNLLRLLHLPLPLRLTQVRYLLPMKIQAGGGGLAKQPDSSVANDSAQLASQSDPPQTTPVVSPQGVTCNTVPLHTPWTGTGGTLLYNIQLSGDGNDCVLELESGTIPNYGGNVRMIPWIGHTPSGGWYYSNNVTKIIVSSHVYALCVSALFIGMLELKSADVTNLDLSNLQFGLFQGMFQCDEKLSSITGIEY